MDRSIVLKVASAIVAFGVVASAASFASANTVWDQLNGAAPRSDGVFGDLQSSAPRSPFDRINTTAPVRSPSQDLVGE